MGFLSKRDDKHGKRQGGGSGEELRMKPLDHRSKLSRERALQQLKEGLGSN
jgi:hypothetical protein